METVRISLLGGLVLEAKFTGYDNFDVIHSASLLMNRCDEVQFDLSIRENQEMVRDILWKKGCYDPIYEWEVEDRLAGEEA